MTYPPNWPKCACGAPVLDAHLTCGRASCSEAEARARRAYTERQVRISVPDQEGGQDLSFVMLTWLVRKGYAVRR